MGRTTIIQNDLAGEGNDQVQQYQDEQEHREDTDVLAGLRELDGSGGVQWRAYRVGDLDQSRNGYVCEVPREMLNMAYLTNKLGPGTYRIEAVSGKGQYLARRTVTIAQDAQRAASATHSVQVGAAMGAFDMRQFYAEQDAREEARRRREDEERERRRKDRNELLTIMAPVAAAVLPALLGRGNGDMAAIITALKPPDPLQSIAALKSLMPETKQENTLDSAFKILDKIGDIGPKEGETGWMDVLKELVKSAGPTVGTVIEGAITRATLASPAAGAQPVLSPNPVTQAPSFNRAAPAVSAENSHSTGDPRMLTLLKLLPWLQAQMTVALTRASKGVEPGLMAETLLADLPDGTDPESLLGIIQRPDWFEMLCKADARVRQHHAWFAHMRAALIEEITQVEFTEPLPDLPTHRNPPSSPRAGIQGTGQSHGVQDSVSGAATPATPNPGMTVTEVTPERGTGEVDRPPPGPPSLS